MFGRWFAPLLRGARHAVGEILQGERSQERKMVSSSSRTPGALTAMFTVLATAGCQAITRSEPNVLGSKPAYAIYACADGSTVQAWYLRPDHVRLLHRGAAIDLTRAISGSGARYVGGGWEWWTKGQTDGLLAPLGPGESIASAAGVSCKAKR